MNGKKLKGKIEMRRKANTTIAMILILFVALFFTQPQTALADSGAGGLGTSADPFLVRDIADLKKIGTGTDGWTFDACYLLANDIDATSGYNYVIADAGEAETGGYGSEITSQIFYGEFDGGGHTITLNINISYAAKVGLFGVVGEGAVIKNLNVAGNVEGKSHVGGIAGVNRGTIKNCVSAVNTKGILGIAGIAGTNSNLVENCFATGKTEGNSMVGGVVGQNNKGAIRKCGSTGDVISHMDGAGGIAGVSLEYGSVVEESYATGDVTGVFRVGGLVGQTERSYIKDCYAMGTVEGGTFVGGLIGESRESEIKNCYAAGNVSASGDNAGGLVGAAYVEARVNDCAALGETVESPYTAGRIAASKSFGPYFNNNFAHEDMETIPATDAEPDVFDKQGGDLDLSDPSTYHQRFFQFILQWDFENIWYWDCEDSLPKLGARGECENNPCACEKRDIETGSGTNKDPFLVYDVFDLRKIGSGVDGWTYTASYLLARDIETPKYYHYEIADGGVYAGVTRVFNGVFDGGGHMITIRMGQKNFLVGGIFGEIGYNGVVKNSRVDGSITGWWTVGGVAATNRGKVENCVVGADISGIKYVGGVIGMNSGTVENCHATGNVDGSEYVGGVVGTGNGDIKNSGSKGDVTGNSDYVGGVTGLQNAGCQGYN